MVAPAPPDTSQVIVFSDYACPWCYLGYARLEKLIDSGAVGERSVRVVHFPLSTDTPKEGRGLEDYLRTRGIPLGAAERLADMCEAEGLTYPRALAGRRIWNTQRAQELAIWAAELGDAKRLAQLHRRLFVAYHVDNLNVYDPQVLAALAGALGFDAELASDAVSSGRYAERRQADWASAIESGVRGVPTFVVGGRGLVGAQPREQLLALLGGA